MEIRTHGTTFGTMGDPESEANWEGALGELVERGLAKDKNNKDTVFLVTREGFRVARQLSNGASQRAYSTPSDYPDMERLSHAIVQFLGLRKTTVATV